MMSFEEASRRLTNSDFPNEPTAHEVVRVLATYVMQYLVRYFNRLPFDIKKDVVQEVLITIQQKGRTARYPKGFARVWTKSKAYTELKRLKRMGSSDELPEPPYEDDSNLVSEEAFEALQKCLREVPDGELRVIEGQFFDYPQKTIRDLAKKLGRSPSTISDMKQRALENLRRCLEKNSINLDWLQDD